ncbi:MAG: hypothetical protein O6945_11385 [Gammaproteobacteria bacterium]|nr:hypothetical protein [Gammaproteobacteria bacterium]
MAGKSLKLPGLQGRCYLSRLISRSLDAIQFSVLPTLFHQRGVRASLGHLCTIQDNDLAGHANGTEAMRDQDCNAAT